VRRYFTVYLSPTDGSFSSSRSNAQQSKVFIVMPRKAQMVEWLNGEDFFSPTVVVKHSFQMYNAQEPFGIAFYKPGQ